MNKLTPAEERVIVYKGTEPPFTGEYDKFYKEGTYLCRRCDAPLYVSDTKFNSGCGWPAFDQEIAGAVKRLPDPDGMRIEIEKVTELPRTARGKFKWVISEVETGL